MSIIEISNLSKYFANTHALRDVNLNIEKGSMSAILGPNGAGKTTLLRIINALLSFDSGTVMVGGEPVSLKTSQKIGYMPEERGLYEKMRVEDQILYFGRLKGGDKSRLRNIMNEYIELFNLKGQERRRVKELSKGNQQKVQIISTIVHEPDLVILDEPFSGFDPINGALLQELLDRLQNKGTTVILSSHNMPAVESICDNITLINNGSVILNGNIDEIKENNKTNKLVLSTRRPISKDILLDSGAIDEIEMKTSRNENISNYLITKKEGVSNNDVLDAIAIQAEIIKFEEALPTLNELYIKYADK